MMLIVVHVLEEFLDERKRDNQSFAVFIVFGVKQFVGETEKISEFRNF
jgi:hypothetical protein